MTIIFLSIGNMGSYISFFKEKVSICCSSRKTKKCLEVDEVVSLLDNRTPRMDGHFFNVKLCWKNDTVAKDMDFYEEYPIMI